MPGIIRRGQSFGTMTGKEPETSQNDDEGEENEPASDNAGITQQRERQQVGGLGKTDVRKSQSATDSRAEQSESQRHLFDLSGVVIANHYELLDVAGEGNISSIYRARHLLINKIMAVKVLKSHNLRKSNLVMRFQREAKLLSTLDHPNIIKFHEFGVHSTEQPYLVLEFVEGRTLEDYITCEGPLEIEQALNVILQVCDALAYLHEREIVHRDLKPENVMLAPGEGGIPQVKLIDFGFADDNPEEDLQDLTKPGSVFGTPNYMSSEQQLGFNVDHRSDIYSLVSVLFFTLTGNPPFMAKSTIETLQRRVNEAPPSLCTALGCDETTRALDEIIDKGMAQNPDDRFQSAYELREPLVKIYNSLQGIEEEPTGKASHSKASSDGKRKNDKTSTNTPLLVGAVAICVLCLGASIFMFWKSNQDSGEGAGNATSDNKTSMRRLETLWKKYDLLGQQQFNTGHYEEATQSFEKALKMASKIDPRGEMVKGSLEELIDVAVAQDKEPDTGLLKTLNEIDARDRQTLVTEAKTLISVLDRIANGEKLEAIIKATTDGGTSSPELIRLFHTRVKRLRSNSSSGANSDDSQSMADYSDSDGLSGYDDRPSSKSAGKRKSRRQMSVEDLCLLALNNALKLKLSNESKLCYELTEKARLAALTLPPEERSFMTEIVFFQTSFGSSAGEGQKSSHLASLSMPEIEKELKQPRKGPVSVEDGNRFVRGYWIATKSLKFNKAHEFLTEAMTIYSQVLGPESIQVANCMNYDAQLYADQGMFVEAKERALEALQIYRGPTVKENASDLYHLNSMANLYIFLGKKDMALKTLREALDQHQKAVLKDWAGISDCLVQITHIGITSRKPEGMDFLCHRAIAIIKRTHPYLKSGPARATRMLGELAKLRGRVSEAEKYFKQALALDLAENQKLALATAADDYRALAELYFSYDTTNGYRQCLESCQEQVKLLNSVYGSETLSVGPAKTLMAKAFVRLGEYGKADALIAEIEKFLSKSKLANPKELNDLLLVKADSFERQGNPVKAEELRTEANRLK
jgi:Serine/threonine protein kinase